MPRDSVTITTPALNAGTDTPAGTTINTTNGAVIAAGGRTRKMLLRITNTNGSDRVATVKAGVGPRAGIGDLAITVPATTGDVLVPVESARFGQANGDIYVDFAASMAGKISALRLPADL